MAQLPIQHQPTIDRIYKYYVDQNIEFRRPHLGASLIGEDCLRKLFYTFRWSSDPNFIGRMQRLFKTGKIEEDRVIKDLRNIGICVYDRDPDSGEQISYSEDGCRHYSGSLDGVVKGILESPEKWHVLEIKSASNKYYNLIKTKGVEKIKPLYYAQMQSYMRWAKLIRAYFVVVNKDTDEIWAERVYYDKDFAENLAQKAKRVVFSPVPPERLGDSENSFCCKWCDHVDICWHGELPLVSCRTCAFVTPEPDGTWTCGRGGEKRVLGESEQKAGCENHIFIPELVCLPLIGADPAAGTVEYEGIVNGPGFVSSVDLDKEIKKIGVGK